MRVSNECGMGVVKLIVPFWAGWVPYMTRPLMLGVPFTSRLVEGAAVGALIGA